MINRLDITGNWCARDGFASCLQVQEPDVPDGKSCVFSQNIIFLPGKYTLELLYEYWLDRRPGRSIADKFDFFDGSIIGKSVRPVPFKAAMENDHLFTASCNFDIPPEGETIQLDLAVCNTRELQTGLCSRGNLTAGDYSAANAAHTVRTDLEVNPFSL